LPLLFAPRTYSAASSRSSRCPAIVCLYGSGIGGPHQREQVVLTAKGASPLYSTPPADDGFSDARTAAPREPN
jgi:hypothetical protein